MSKYRLLAWIIGIPCIPFRAIAEAADWAIDKLIDREEAAQLKKSHG